MFIVTEYAALKPQPIRDMTVKCVGSVRHIDVKEYSKLKSLGPYQ